MEQKTKILTGIGILVLIILIGGWLIWNGQVFPEIPDKYKRPLYCEEDGGCKIIGGCCSFCTSVNKFHDYIECSQRVCIDYGECQPEDYTAKCIDNKCVAEPAKQQVAITTDKIEYEQGEAVKITITNNLGHSIVPHARSDDYSVYYGENYGIGFIERFKNGTWSKIEPLWRCGNSCFAECKYKSSFEPGEERVFEWNQTRFACDKSNFSEKVEKAGAGRHRISSDVWVSEKEGYEIIYSNEFMIKSCEDSDPRYCEHDGDCVCEQSKGCFMGNKNYYENCINESRKSSWMCLDMCTQELCGCINNKCDCGHGFA